MTRQWSFIIVAGGKGSRLGGKPKQIRLLGGTPLWTWSARCAQVLFNGGHIRELLLVVPEGMEQHFDLSSLTLPIRVVVGGKTRTDSVRAGLKAARHPFVLIHDAARPFLSATLCRNLIEVATESRGAVPLCAVSDALKILQGEKISALNRETIRSTQTPQAFARIPLLKRLDGLEVFSDEAEAWLAGGGELAVVEGERMNFKVTDETDWTIAQALTHRCDVVRVGHGFDVHPLVPGRALVLGGVPIDSPLGLDGHSDADIVCHALSDALLGAAGLPDLGTLYPASEERYRGADSYILLQDVFRRVGAEGWEVLWADVTLHAQVPRLGPSLPAIRARLGELFDRKSDRRINIKVKSGERVGPVGSCSCMECHAVATVRRGG